MMVRVLLPLLLVFALASCDDARTEVVVVVNSDLTTPDDIDNVTITVTAPDLVEQTAMATFDATSPGFPRTLGIERTSSVDGEYEVEVVARKNGVLVVRRRARFEFTEGARRMLRVALRAECVGVACGGNTTCGEGAFCERPNQTTEPFDVDALGTDAGL